MMTKGVIVALALLAAVERNVAYTCDWCKNVHTDEIHPDVECGPTPTCSYGKTTGVCGCCEQCYRGPGEKCGVPYYGTCSDGYICDLPHSGYGAAGICIEDKRERCGGVLQLQCSEGFKCWLSQGICYEDESYVATTTDQPTTTTKEYVRKFPWISPLWE